MEALTLSLALPERHRSSLHGPALQQLADVDGILVRELYHGGVLQQRLAVRLLACEGRVARRQDAVVAHKRDQLVVRQPGVDFDLVAGDGHVGRVRDYVLEVVDGEVRHAHGTCLPGRHEPFQRVPCRDEAAFLAC